MLKWKVVPLGPRDQMLAPLLLMTFIGYGRDHEKISLKQNGLGDQGGWIRMDLSSTEQN